jgi:hypothetical protein
MLETAYRLKYNFVKLQDERVNIKQETGEGVCKGPGE